MKKKKILIEFELETLIENDTLKKIFEKYIKEKYGEKIEVRIYNLNR